MGLPGEQSDERNNWVLSAYYRWQSRQLSVTSEPRDLAYNVNRRGSEQNLVEHCNLRQLVKGESKDVNRWNTKVYHVDKM